MRFISDLFLKGLFLLPMLTGAAFADYLPVISPEQLNTPLIELSTLKILGKPIMNKSTQSAIALQCHGENCTHFQPILITKQGARLFGGIFKNDNFDLRIMQSTFRHSVDPTNSFNESRWRKKEWWKSAFFPERLEKMTVKNGWNWSIESQRVSNSRFNRIFNFLFSYLCCKLYQDNSTTNIAVPDYLRPFSNGTTFNGPNERGSKVRKHLSLEVKYFVSTGACKGMADFIDFNEVSPFSNVGAKIEFPVYDWRQAD